MFTLKIFKIYLTNEKMTGYVESDRCCDLSITVHLSLYRLDDLQVNVDISRSSFPIIYAIKQR